MSFHLKHAVDCFLWGPDCYNPGLEGETANSLQAKLEPGSALFFKQELWAGQLRATIAVRLWTIPCPSLGQSGSLHQSRRD